MAQPQMTTLAILFLIAAAAAAAPTASAAAASALPCIKQCDDDPKVKNDPATYKKCTDACTVMTKFAAASSGDCPKDCDADPELKGDPAGVAKCKDFCDFAAKLGQAATAAEACSKGCKGKAPAEVAECEKKCALDLDISLGLISVKDCYDDCAKSNAYPAAKKACEEGCVKKELDSRANKAA